MDVNNFMNKKKKKARKSEMKKKQYEGMYVFSVVRGT